MDPYTYKYSSQPQQWNLLWDFRKAEKTCFPNSAGAARNNAIAIIHKKKPTKMRPAGVESGFHLYPNGLHVCKAFDCYHRSNYPKIPFLFSLC